MDIKKVLVPLIILSVVLTGLFFLLPGKSTGKSLHQLVNSAIKNAKAQEFQTAENDFMKALTLVDSYDYLLKPSDIPDLTNLVLAFKDTAEELRVSFRNMFSAELKDAIENFTTPNEEFSVLFFKEINSLLAEKDLIEKLNINIEDFKNDPETGFITAPLIDKITNQTATNKDIIILNRVILGSLFKVFPKPLFSYSIKFNIAMLKMQKGDKVKSEALLKEIITEEKHYIKPYRLLMEIKIKEGDYAQAIEVVKGALEVNNNNEILLLDLAFLYNKTNKINMAKELIEQVLEINPDSPYALNDMKILERKKERKLKTSAFYEKILKKMPADLGVRSNLIIAYLKEGKDNKAEKLLSETLKDNPEDVYLLKIQGRMYGDKGNLKEAARIFRSIYKTAKDTDPDVVMLYGITLYNQGLTNQAEEILAIGEETFPDNHYIILNLAKVRNTIPEKQQAALAGYKKYLQLRPKDKNSVKIKKIIRSLEEKIKNKK